MSTHTTADDHRARLEAAARGFFPALLGIRFVSAAPERIVAELDVRDDLCTVPGVMHGGVIMGLADSLGGMATALNLPPDHGTTTIESKTNFLAAGRAGTTVTAECLPLHRGGRTMAWQTTVRGPDGRTIAVVTQTQLVLEPRRSPAEQVAALFQGRSPAEQRALLAELEATLDEVRRGLPGAAG